MGFFVHSEVAAEGFLCAGHVPAASPRIAAKTTQPTAPSDLAAISNRVDVVVVYAQFASEGRQPVPDYANAIFDLRLPGSLSHFYDTMSFGQMEIRGTVLPERYVSSRPAASYLSDGEAGGYVDLVEEILRQADDDVDWRQYDNDGPDGLPNSGDDDGIVDYVFINMLSTPRGFLGGGATGRAGLGFDSSLATADVGLSGLSIVVSGASDRGAVLREGSFSQTVGSMAHEFGHALLLPDLYDFAYGAPSEDSAGIGFWGLMGWGAHGWNGGDGPVAFSAWSLEQLGWIGPGNDRLVEIFQDTTGLVVEDLRNDGYVYKIPLGLASDPGNDFEEEYLLLEQRTRTRYNRNVAAEGLLVWHIRPQATSNNEERSKLVDLVCADGLFRDAGYPSGRQADGEEGLDNLDYWAHDGGYASARDGNLGDATDPFDGVRFRQLRVRSNPSSNLLRMGSSAYTGLDMTFSRLGSAMSVDLLQPRWAGTIDEEIHWGGNVLVDGDFRVGPEGALVIHDHTQVRFAGSDRLRSGRDSGLIEFKIEGDFRILTDSDAASVVFDALDPERPWYGILFSPTSSSVIEAPDDSYSIRNAANSVVLLDAPADSSGQITRRIDLIDSARGETAGNDDGRLSPGESFRFDVEIGNWTLTGYRDIHLRLSWNTSAVYPSWSTDVTGDDLIVRSEPFTLSPGSRTTPRLPSLTVSPDADSGEPLRFVFEATGYQLEAFRDTLEFEIEGRSPVRGSEIEVYGDVRSESALVGRHSYFRASAQGEIEKAYMIVRSLSNPTSFDEIPMTRSRSLPGESVFSAAYWPTASDQYQAQVRMHARDGSVVLSEQDLFLWANETTTLPDIVVFVGDQYEASEVESLRRIITRETAAQGLSVRIFDVAPDRGALYRTILPHYAAQNGLVIWMGRTMDERTRETFRDFLEDDGRLMLATLWLNRSRNMTSRVRGGGMGPFYREILHVSSVRRWGQRLLPIESVGLSEPLDFTMHHAPLALIAPAEPILLNSRREVAGMRLDTGTYRLVYLPFDIGLQEEDIVRPLLGSSIGYLLEQPAPQIAPSLKASVQVPSLSNSPNPFNAETTISYVLDGETPVTLTVYDILGQPVRHLVRDTQGAGHYSVGWDGRDNTGRPVGSGVYLYSLATDMHEVKRRLLLLK